ncbi:class I SAM-dependent methyltransferase [Agrilutibacter solisilvae]|uniref:Methyltransferase domain-containing protein n=1 Tax=Agrilutibacter solisilvae TaxID=2763317 RepID=A0A974Y1G0_9GAMM|nr:class I SAM-dependent methyltransferase [Lysobacter solisilvae]QSX79661.1 methyltransferase domain-containing protein [Lysobacter solisilvae]
MSGPAQVTDGLRAILSHPAVYSGFQKLLGAERSRRKLSQEHLRVQPGDVVVDVGCGPADILECLPRDIEYHGFDLSQRYIDAARDRYGDRGIFHCADVQDLVGEALPPCQLAIAIGLLHHLDDPAAMGLISSLYERLAPGGRLVTLDGGYWPGQSRIGRALARRDRGQHVRTAEGYAALVDARFSRVEVIRREDLLLVPYSHVILECTK